MNAVIMVITWWQRIRFTAALCLQPHPQQQRCGGGGPLTTATAVYSSQLIPVHSKPSIHPAVAGSTVSQQTFCFVNAAAPTWLNSSHSHCSICQNTVLFLFITHPFRSIRFTRPRGIFTASYAKGACTNLEFPYAAQSGRATKHNQLFFVFCFFVFDLCPDSRLAVLALCCCRNECSLASVWCVWN